MFCVIVLIIDIRKKKECEFFQVETRSAIWQYFKDPWWEFFKYYCPR